MINIQLENPSIEQYIKEFGKQELEKMIISFLEIKAKLNQASKKKSSIDESYKKAKEFGVSRETHQKILSLKPNKSKTSSEMIELIDEISSRFGDKYSDISDDELRDEYYRYKGYL